MKKITLKEVSELVTFYKQDGNWFVMDVLGDVCGSVGGSVGGDVGRNIIGNVGGIVLGDIGGPAGAFVWLNAGPTTVEGVK